MIKYRTQFDKIDEIEIERETEKQVILKNGKRENKRSEFTVYHDTWDEAHEFLIETAQANVDFLRLKLERAKGELGQIKGMKPN